MNVNRRADGSLAAGYYKGRAIVGSEQYGLTEKGGDQIALDIELVSGDRVTTLLYFTDAAAPYAIERLRACGWVGDDVTQLDGIEKNEIDVQIKYETFEGKERMKADIATGGGRLTLSRPMDPQQKRAFAARMKQAVKNGLSKPPAKTGQSKDGDEIPEWLRGA